MPKTRRPAPKPPKSWLARQSAGALLAGALLGGGLLAITSYLGYRAYQVEGKIFHLYFLALLLGLLFEFKRLGPKWSAVGWTALAAWVLSFLAFIPLKGDPVYVLADRLAWWPVCFLGGFILSVLTIYSERLTRPLTEGTALLLTLAVNYWLAAHGFWGLDNLVVRALLLASTGASLFSVYHALANRPLSERARRLLSIWCAAATLLLALENLLWLYHYRHLEELPSLAAAGRVFLQFFLLGVSSIYLAHNLSLLTPYLPGRRYRAGVREINAVHTARFAPTQVAAGDSLLVVLVMGTGFGLNYALRILPVSSMIWLLLVLTPYLLPVLRKLARRQEAGGAAPNE